MPAPRILVSDVMETKKLPIIAADQTLQKAAETMLANNALAAVTLDVERRPSLILSYRRLLRLIAEGVNPAKATMAEHAVTDPVVVRYDDTVEEALDIMRREAVRELPVVDERNKIRGYLEARHIAFRLWKLLPYGAASVDARAHNPVIVPGTLTLREAAKAMDRNGVTEAFVRTGEGELRVLREWDLLEAVAKGEDLDQAKVEAYARGPALRVPAGYDARAAIELMEENQVQRLLVAVHHPESGRQELRVVTASELAFEAGVQLKRLAPKAVALVLANVEPGREDEVARKLIDVEGVTEVLSVPGIYDLAIRVEAETVDQVAAIVTRSIRGLREIRDTLTLIAAPLYKRKR